ncbi:hypothetical protein GR925_22285 [Streptomyces sp. HUCO-GS316]|uniref:hypothetical protein n=1 Tax=Streptomyces sp. HUCO-GS316 TaxID=2692198 RepID=UPI001367C121|nr:hypothetical protein [Streptomyces sp. HUCO-GS316]MXM66102.1 hypothetical protein [Streptomyces sp. HUCO-GS316]
MAVPFPRWGWRVRASSGPVDFEGQLCGDGVGVVLVAGLVAFGVRGDPLVGGLLGAERAQQRGEGVGLGAVERRGDLVGEAAAPGVGELLGDAGGDTDVLGVGHRDLR